MKDLDVYALGNGIVDVFVEISEEEFSALGMDKGTMRLVEVEEQKELLAKFQGQERGIVSGGSVANSVIVASQLGAKAAFACCLGDDKYGAHYQKEFKELNIELNNPLIKGATTGTCVALITPDAERTMRTCLGVASTISAEHISEEAIKRSSWVFLEGYVFANPEHGHSAVAKAIECAKKHDCKIAITVSEAWVIEAFSDLMREAVSQADLIFANEVETCSLAGIDDFDKAYAELKSQIPNLALTCGAKGAKIFFDGQEADIPCVPCTPVDLTGAGDMFAGTFLYSITHGSNAKEAGSKACEMASKVICQIGARLS